jgi:hypothetical protein
MVQKKREIKWIDKAEVTRGDEDRLQKRDGRRVLLIPRQRRRRYIFLRVLSQNIHYF